MRAARAQNSEWAKCHFEYCDFDSSDFSGARLLDCSFLGCSFQNAVFIGCDVYASFVECDMVSTNFTNARIHDSSFDECKMEYSSFLDCNISHLKFTDSNLSGAYLLYMYAKDIDYSGSNLHNVSIKLGCPFFRDAKFDRRQWSYMQSLISQVSGVKELQEHVLPHIDPLISRAVARMMYDDHEAEEPC